MALNDVVNTFKPLASSPSAAGRSMVLNDRGVGTALTSAANFSQLIKQRAYARLDAGSITRANPEFDRGSAGRILASLTETNKGNDPRITRGYIRRTVVNDGGDPTSSYRLYFMYNPGMIQRAYVSYLDQDALDPFNTVFGSNNLVAPPGVLDFSFDLFFDRQVENASGDMPRGVLEDFDYFDLVVRGVVPDPQQPDLPDNGIMLVNPRNITVVFSPQLSVQGRPSSAAVNYTKFDHNMRPTQLTISLGMKVFYIGPVRPDFTFAQSKEEGTAQATISYEQSINVTMEQEAIQFATSKLQAPPDVSGTTPGGPAVGLASGGGADIRMTALTYAEYIMGDGRVSYLTGSNNPTRGGVDCAGLIDWAYWQTGALGYLGIVDTNYHNGNDLYAAAQKVGTIMAAGPTFNDNFLQNGAQVGDILDGPEHVAFISGIGPGTITCYESIPQGVSHNTYSFNGITDQNNQHRCVIRPGAGGGSDPRPW
jgi:hypothetical protein